MNENSSKDYFTEQLLQWYTLHKRDLPWRRTHDPYQIWVSEVMLQQTQVDTVIPYYERFLSRFPTLEALAEAPEEEVLKNWEGLGYYSRARNLHAAVKEVVAEYGARVPDSPEAIRQLKGVGPYTAGAVLSIAFNVPEPAVDGNVLRVLSRYLLIDKDIAKSSTRVYMENIVRGMIPEGQAGDFNQALMELGATICTPKTPSCETCPVALHCAGRQSGRVMELPVKTKAKRPRHEHRFVLLAEGEGSMSGCILLRQRPESGLLAGMWELPHVLLPIVPAPARGKSLFGEAAIAEEELEDQLMQCRYLFSEEAGIDVAARSHVLDTKHVFSHIYWHLRVFAGQLAADNHLPEGWHWVPKHELPKLSFPVVFSSILKDQGWLA